MPTYEYKCTLCTNRFDVEQRITDDALTTMEGCTLADDGMHTLKKVFSSIGISFKGDGFYRNDARGKSSQSSTPSTTTSGDSSSSSGDSSSSSSSSSSETSSGGSNGAGTGGSAGTGSSAGTTSPAKATTSSD